MAVVVGRLNVILLLLLTATFAFGVNGNELVTVPILVDENVNVGVKLLLGVEIKVVVVRLGAVVSITNVSNINFSDCIPSELVTLIHISLYVAAVNAGNINSFKPTNQFNESETDDITLAPLGNILVDIL